MHVPAMRMAMHAALVCRATQDPHALSPHPIIHETRREVITIFMRNLDAISR